MASHSRQPEQTGNAPFGAPVPPLPGAESADLLVRNSREEIDAAEQRLLELLTRHGYGDAARFALRLAFEEAIVNAFRHGHKGMPASTPAEVALRIGPVEAVIAVTDQGQGFIPDTVPDCTLDENLEKTSGRGLMLMRSFMTGVEHELGGRRVVMRFKRDG